MGLCCCGPRSAAILAELLAADAAIVALQEVEHTAYSDELLPALWVAGYTGLVQAGRERTGGGVATFWRASAFKLVGECHRSRSSVVVLRAVRGTAIQLAPPSAHPSAHTPITPPPITPPILRQSAGNPERWSSTMCTADC